MMSRVEASGIRLCDIHIFAAGVGIVGIGALAYGFVDLAAEIVTATSYKSIDLSGFGLSALVGLIAVGFAYEDARPRTDGYCASCGGPVVMNCSADETVSEIQMHVSKPPSRLSIGPHSFVTHRRCADRLYCSVECADSDPAMPRLVDEEPMMEQLSDVDGRASEVSD